MPHASPKARIEVVPAEREPPPGLFGLGFEVMRPFPPDSEDAAEQLFRYLVSLLDRTPEVIEIDIRSSELHNCVFFGKSEHPRLAWDEADAFRRCRLRGDHDSLVRVVRAPNIDAALEVVRETDWFTIGAYGVVLDDEVLVDKMYDGIYMEVISRKPLRQPTTEPPASRE